MSHEDDQELYETLLLAIVKSVVRSADAFRQSPAQEIVDAEGKSTGVLFDSYFFHQWVNSIPKVVRPEFEEELTKVRLTPSIWRRVAHNGFPDTDSAKAAFTLSAKFNKCEPTRYLSSYLAFCDDVDADLFALRNLEGEVATYRNLSETSARPAPGQIIGPSDSRLQPREKLLVGREQDVQSVQRFLMDSSTRNLCVAGLAGIGKSEICKAAILNYLKTDPESVVIWVQVPDKCSIGLLIYHIGKSIGLSEERLNSVATIEEVLLQLPNDTLLYLDNLEGVLDDEVDFDAMSTLTSVSGVRLLASSRVAFFNFGSTYIVEALADCDAILLFKHCWPGEPIEEGLIKPFVVRQLGNHPLAISLVARLGRAYSLQRIIEDWHKHGTLIANSGSSNSRTHSLDVSFALTRNHVSQFTGALDLWQFIALFDSNCPLVSIDVWESRREEHGARLALVDSHLITIDSHGVAMLPPVSRYALYGENLSRDPSHSFEWRNVSQDAFAYFLEISEAASDIGDEQEIRESRRRTIELMAPILRLVERDSVTQDPRILDLRELHSQLSNVYLLSPRVSLELLVYMRSMFADSMSSRSLGIVNAWYGDFTTAFRFLNEAVERSRNEEPLELASAYRELGKVEEQLGYYDQALKHLTESADICLAESESLGYANALRSLCNLELQVGNTESAKDNAEKAIRVYRKERANIGVANVLLTLGSLAYQEQAFDIALDHISEAKELFELEHHKKGVADACTDLGKVLLAKQELQQALDEINAALSAYEETGDVSAIAIAFGVKARIYFVAEYWKEAFDCFKSAVIYFDKVRSDQGMAINLAGSMVCKQRMSEISKKDLRDGLLTAIKFALAAAGDTGPAVRDVLTMVALAYEDSEEDLREIIDSAERGRFPEQFALL